MTLAIGSTVGKIATDGTLIEGEGQRTFKVIELATVWRDGKTIIWAMLEPLN